MPEIVTVTFSPCIDKSTSVPAMLPDKKLKCKVPKFEPGGGGINVARAIKKLGGEVVAIFPSGGYTGKHLNHLMEVEHIDVVIVECAEATRENIIIFDESRKQQYRFGMPQTGLTSQEWSGCLEAIENLNGIKYIVVSGSLPPTDEKNIFDQLSKIARKKHARLIVDTSGEALQKAANVGVYLLKPNLGELSALSGREINNIADAERAARELIQKGSCEIVVVSLGKDGALMVTAFDALHVHPPKVEVKSTVGAGDSMVAGIVHCLIRNKSLKETLHYAVAAGTAATLHPGTELCNEKDTDRLFKLISKNQ